METPKPEWKDASSWSRGEDRTEPKTVALQLPVGPRLVVTRHIHFPGKWVASAGDLMTQRELAADALDAAKREAITLLREKLSHVCDLLALALT